MEPMIYFILLPSYQNNANRFTSQKVSSFVPVMKILFYHKYNKKLFIKLINFRSSLISKTLHFKSTSEPEFLKNKNNKRNIKRNQNNDDYVYNLQTSG